MLLMLAFTYIIVHSDWGYLVTLLSSTMCRTFYSTEDLVGQLLTLFYIPLCSFELLLCLLPKNYHHVYFYLSTTALKRQNPAGSIWTNLFLECKLSDLSFKPRSRETWFRQWAFFSCRALILKYWKTHNKLYHKNDEGRSISIN